jgi:hypothetical protein
MTGKFAPSKEQTKFILKARMAAWAAHLNVAQIRGL